MGFILSKFLSKPSIENELEKIEVDLRNLSRLQHDTEQQQMTIVGRIVKSGAFLYLVSLILIYFCGPRDLSWKEAFGWISPFILFPILLFATKALLDWYFNQKIVKIKKTSISLKMEKQRILEEVMDTESYNVAMKILQKYAPDKLKHNYYAETPRTSPPSLTSVPKTAGIRRRTSTNVPESRKLKTVERKSFNDRSDIKQADPFCRNNIQPQQEDIPTDHAPVYRQCIPKNKKDVGETERLLKDFKQYLKEDKAVKREQPLVLLSLEDHPTSSNDLSLNHVEKMLESGSGLFVAQKTRSFQIHQNGRQTVLKKVDTFVKRDEEFLLNSTISCSSKNVDRQNFKSIPPRRLDHHDDDE